MIWLQIPWELCWAILLQSSCIQRSRQQKRETEKCTCWQRCPFWSCSLFTLFCLQLSGTEFCKKTCRNVLTNCSLASIILKLSRNAAIAQPVERILGKDEVASSNLASSSKKEPIPFGIGSFFRYAGFENQMRRGWAPPARAGPSRTSIHIPRRECECKQIWLAVPKELRIH